MKMPQNSEPSDKSKKYSASVPKTAPQTSTKFPKAPGFGSTKLPKGPQSKVSRKKSLKIQQPITEEEKPLSVIKEVLLKFSRHTAIIGPAFIAESTKPVLTFIWSFLFLGAIVLTFSTVITQVIYFMDCPVTIQIDLEYDTLAFPSVTVCNMNPVRRSKIDSLPDSAIKTLLKRLRSGNKPTQNPNGLSLEDQFNLDYSMLKREEQIDVGHEMKFMLLTCAFETAVCSWDKDFVVHMSSTYGSCYTFNSLNLLESTEPGRQFGLSLMLFLQLDEQIEGLDRGSGIRLALSEQKLPNPNLDGMYVAAGTDTDIGISLINSTWMEKPCGICNDSKSEFKTSYAKQPYNKQFCQRACVHKYIAISCACYDNQNVQYYPDSKIKSLKPCASVNHTKCMTKLKRKRFSSFADAHDEKTLSCDCPNHCHERKFETEISSTIWPATNYVDKLINKVCEETENVKLCNKLINSTDQRKMANFLKVNVFYRDLNYQSVVQTRKYPYEMFLPDLGGSIGLYLGLSVLSIFELVPLTYLLIRALCCKKKVVKPLPMKSRSGHAPRSKPKGTPTTSKVKVSPPTSVLFNETDPDRPSRPSTPGPGGEHEEPPPGVVFTDEEGPIPEPPMPNNTSHVVNVPDDGTR